MKIGINDISLSDVPIQMTFDASTCILKIFAERVFRLSDKSWYNNAIITIKNWQELSVEKYVSEHAFKQGENYQINWQDGIETFELIQELDLYGNETLSIKGFSKESGAWLTYMFRMFDSYVEAESPAEHSVLAHSRQAKG